jgi:hypothetical protein
MLQGQILAMHSSVAVGLGIRENNLPIPNASEWELKTQRIHTTSLTTLIHSEPSPRAIRFVPHVFLPKYGWPSQEAGKLYPLTEMSFRQTIHGLAPSDRGFMVKIDRTQRKILIAFDASKVAPKHAVWLQQVKQRVGLIHTAVSFASFFFTTLVERGLNAALLGACPTEKMQAYPLHGLES